jgi:hypothetical protein
VADDPKLPKRSKGDVAHAVAKAGISALPIVGGPAAELFQFVVQPPLDKRRAEWMADVGEKLRSLEERGLKLEDLQNNPQFISTVMHASTIALRTHQQAKLDALKNAISHVAQRRGPDETMQHLFLDFIDSLTEAHLRILKVFDAPTPPLGLSMGSLSNVLEHNIPELRGRGDLYDQLWRDLYGRGLVNTESLHGTISGSGLAQRRTTNLGLEFLRFIAES